MSTKTDTRGTRWRVTIRYTPTDADGRPIGGEAMTAYTYPGDWTRAEALEAAWNRWSSGYETAAEHRRDAETYRATAQREPVPPDGQPRPVYDGVW